MFGILFWVYLLVSGESGGTIPVGCARPNGLKYNHLDDMRPDLGRFVEETPAVSPALTTAESLVPHLKSCGYGDAQLERPFKVDEVSIPVAAFAGRPFDSWSACIAAIDLNGDSKASAAKIQVLGASTVFVCGPQRVDWWAMGPGGPTTSRSIAWPDVGGVFRDHKEELKPSRIYNAKLRRPTDSAKQPWFFDLGLMPAIEKNRGETLLRLVENAIAGLHEELGAKLDTRQAQEDGYRTVFWLLAAKVLHDKKVDNFIRIDLKNVDEVFDRIGKHHGETNRFPPFGREGRRAIDEVAETFERCGSLADVSSESIAYVYENALVDQAAGGKKVRKGEKPYDIRKELGIHSTPSVLIHHMLSQLWSMIAEIQPENRNVFEPACGHAPFLTAAMRWLRDWNQGDQSNATHEYLRSHLHGLEADGFALELAKLALTLADEPYGNKWQLTLGDMFMPGVLAKHAKKAHILLANPPYEAFNPAQRARYARAGEAVTANTKATEMLLRTLPHLPPGAVLGVVMPQGVLHDKESKPVRERLLADFDLSEIGVFADNLFEHGDQEVAVLMGRRKKSRAKPVVLHYCRVREHAMQGFKERSAFSSEREVSQNRFEESKANLLLPDLVEVWDLLKESPTLGNVAEIQQGFQFLNEETLKGREVISNARRAGWVKAILRAADDYNIWQLPKTVWIDASREHFRRPGAVTKLGVPQVVLNYNPVSRGPWRLKAAVDHEGIAISSNFVVVRPMTPGISLRSIWAVLNSPFANAYAYAWSGKRHMLVKEWRAFPLPVAPLHRWGGIEAAASTYLVAVEASESAFMQAETRNQVKQALLTLDAEVLKLYDLPPRLERQLLDLFTGVERKGVGCDFLGYYPLGFMSYLPLHMLISDHFQRAAADVTADRFKPGESAYVRDVLGAAAVGPGEE
jgi:hypothetical protein